MVLVSAEMNASACEEFEADIYLLYHSSQIGKGFEATMHVGSVCQTCKIVAIEGKVGTTDQS